MEPHRDSVDYWKAVTAEQEEQLTRHPVPKKDVYGRFLAALAIAPGDRVLDVGIGFGRLIPCLLEWQARVYGVDIDPEMVATARREQGERCELLAARPAEETGFEENFFDHLVCWASFDEFAQGPALWEMNRVLKPGGKAVLTGKNTLYEVDDREALEAEEACRAKGHPNHFTRFAAIDLELFGFRPWRGEFFRRRGDFAMGDSCPEPPERFYEYALILTKTGSARCSQAEVPEIAETVSATFRQVGGQG